MQKFNTLPGWFKKALRSSENRTLHSSIFHDSHRECFFTGIVGALLEQGVVPHRIDIAMDANFMAPIIQFQIGPDDDVVETQHYPMNPESFASLWNDPPATITGFPIDKIRLYLQAGNERFPIETASGILAELFLYEGEFFIIPVVKSDFMEIA